MRSARGLAIALALALAVCSAAARAQSAGEWATSAQLWRATCADCHDGKLAPELLGAALSAQAIVSAVRRGPSAMPTFAPSEIGDRELALLAEWIRAQPKPVPASTDESERTARHATRQRTR